jgi:hypothetical protein
MDIIYAEKYYKQIQERYPYLSEKQIDKIIKYGLRSFFVYNKLGGDVLLKSNYYTAYIGKLYNKIDLFAKYYNIKMRIKLRIKYRRAKTVFNGKYYFGLKKDEYNTLFGKGKQKSKKLKFDKLIIYKIYDECLLYNPDYVFEFDHDDIGFQKAMRNFVVKRYHLIAKSDKNGIIKPIK